MLASADTLVRMFQQDPSLHLLKWLPLVFKVEDIQLYLDYNSYNRALFNSIIFKHLQEILPQSEKIMARDNRHVSKRLNMGTAQLKQSCELDSSPSSTLYIHDSLQSHHGSAIHYTYNAYGIAPVYTDLLFRSKLCAQASVVLWRSQQRPLRGPNWIAGAGLGWAKGSAATVGLC